jgi:hypothetical protein
VESFRCVCGQAPVNLIVRAHVNPTGGVGAGLLSIFVLAVALHLYEGLFEWTVSIFSLAVVAWYLTLTRLSLSGSFHIAPRLRSRTYGCRSGTSFL